MTRDNRLPSHHLINKKRENGKGRLVSLSEYLSELLANILKVSVAFFRFSTKIQSSFYPVSFGKLSQNN